MEKDKDRVWLPARRKELRKHAKSGTYYLHAKVAGTTIDRSLKTKSEDQAIQRAERILSQERRRVKKLAQAAEAPMDFATALEATHTREGRARHWAPRTADYHRDNIKLLEKVWARHFRKPLKEFSPALLQSLMTQLGGQFSATRHNGCLSLVQWTFLHATHEGWLPADPSSAIHRKPIHAKDFYLPTDSEFTALIARLRESDSPHIWKLVQFLALTGTRITEAQNVEVRDVDWQKNLITIRSRLKRGAMRWVPILPELRPLLADLTTGRTASTKLIVCKTARYGLLTACRDLGLPPLNHHSFRKYFATKCLEQGIDLLTVASWTGHKNLQTIKDFYHRSRAENSVHQAQSLNFGIPTEQGNIITITGKGGN